VFVITPAFVFDNAATVVEIAFARRTYFTLRQRPSDVECAKRTVVQSQTHSSTLSFASQTRAARSRRDRRVKVALMRDAPREFKKRAKVKLIRGLSRQWVLTSHDWST